jgi:hypothetical protein
MKKITLIILITFSNFICNAQNITFAELVKSESLPFEKLELFLSSKKFEFFNIVNDSEDLSKAYNFSYPDEVGRRISYYTRRINADGSSYTTFQLKKSNFDKIRTQGLTAGMKYILKEELFDNKGYFTKYKYGKYFIEFYTAEGTQNLGTIVYEINVYKAI